MWSRRSLPLLLALWVAATVSACGSRQALEPAVIVDENLERVSRGAGRAFGKGAFEQAIDLYRETLEYAYARDDREIIVDTQYNLAVVLLRTGAMEEARAAVDGAKAELARSSQAIPADLQLLDATLLFHAGQVSAAWELSEHALAKAAEVEPDVLARLHFLRGLIAAEQGDQAQLRTSLAALEAADSGALEVDQAELRGRLEMAERNWGAAVAAFVKAAALQQEALDYPNMARALAMAGEASVQMGELREAAIFFFRAGRSAVRLDMAEQARQWLTWAQQLAQEIGDTRMRMDIMVHLITLQARESGQDQ
ncbi:hypothetical protein [Candidatus Entotheonella palauensis]|uniref:hypothetical protein n=1 Tax=Candidatus Entotheonella palauensis TaxID=93172 RepID=UPI001177A341|nr:hypothetical protein [Candidatus Entotheonella palauensis]